MTTYKNYLTNNKPLLIITTIGIIVLLFLILSGCNKVNNRGYIICSQGNCDTIIGEPTPIGWGGIRYHKSDTEEVIIMGNYTKTLIK